MAKRGRKSAADLAVIVSGTFGRRPDPPADLTPRQAEIWRETAASEHADFFSTAALRGLLYDYCGHREAAEKIAKTINESDPECLTESTGTNRYHQLLRMRDLETRGAAAIATKLRLTNQARYQPRAAASAARSVAKGAKPWRV